MKQTLHGYIDAVNKGETTPEVVLAGCISAIEKENSSLNALITPTSEYANQKISEFSSRLLKGAPIAVKDNILSKGVRATCGSKILEDYVAPYSATVFKKLEAAGGVMIGRANMDEFAMGSSGEYSAYGPALNPYATDRVPGGSSSGSAVAVASGMALAALGTDTAGSVRFPAALCGIVGAKPTYGRTSRYGVQSMGSSFDQVGVMTKTVDDAALLLHSISGYDPADSMSVERPSTEMEDWLDVSSSVEGLKFAVPKQFFSTGLDSRIADSIRNQIKLLEERGAIIEEVDTPLFDDVLPVYYALMPAEVTTNLGRFDGLRFGAQGDTSEHGSLHDYYAAIRSEFIGDEVRRRIVTGSYVLSSANYDGFFLKAQKLRRMISNACSEIFEKYDAIIGPTAPEVPRKFGQKSADPLTMYLTDIYTVIANIVGLPAMSVPCGFINEEGVDLPVGFHIMTNHWREDMMFRIGRAVETK